MMVTESQLIAGTYGEKPPEDEFGIYVYGPNDPLSEIVESHPDAFNIDLEAAAAIERGEKTPLQVKEEKAAALGMTLRDYLTEEQVAKDRAAWNESVRRGVDPRTGKALEGGAFEPPRTEKYGYGKYGRVDDLHAQGFKYGDKPPDDWKAPDYSPEGRIAWQEQVFKKIGGNPYEFNVARELEKVTQMNARKWFNDAFRGQIRYEDRHKMSKKQRDHWQQQLNRGRAYLENDLETQLQHMKFQYDVGMKLFDDKAAAYKAAKKEQDKFNNAEVDMHNPETGIKGKFPRKEVADREAEGWLRGLPMNESKYKEEDSPDVGRYKTVLDSILKASDPDNLGEDGEMLPESKAIINNMLTSLDLPTLEELADVGVDGKITDKSRNTILGKIGQLLKGLDVAEMYAGHVEPKSKEVAPSSKEETEETGEVAQIQYSTPEDVRAAFQRGKITREQAKKVLMEQF